MAINPGSKVQGSEVKGLTDGVRHQANFLLSPQHLLLFSTFEPLNAEPWSPPAPPKAGKPLNLMAQS
jgi:hypothetical protein